jgi:hypothetical protein
LKTKRWAKISWTNLNTEKAGVLMLMTDKNEQEIKALNKTKKFYNDDKYTS